MPLLHFDYDPSSQQHPQQQQQQPQSMTASIIANGELPLAPGHPLRFAPNGPNNNAARGSPSRDFQQLEQHQLQMQQQLQQMHQYQQQQQLHAQQQHQQLQQQHPRTRPSPLHRNAHLYKGGENGGIGSSWNSISGCDTSNPNSSCSSVRSSVAREDDDDDDETSEEEVDERLGGGGGDAQADFAAAVARAAELQGMDVDGTKVSSGAGNKGRSGK